MMDEADHLGDGEDVDQIEEQLEGRGVALGSALHDVEPDLVGHGVRS